MARTILFSERYSSIIESDSFSTEFTPEIYTKIINCLFEFDQPGVEQVSRYDRWTIHTSASKKASTALFEKHRWPVDRIDDIDAEWLFRQGYAVTFDLIELWFIELSSEERRDFQDSINKIFDDYNQPWRFVGGKLFRVDYAQFERDLQLKHAALLQEVACSKPVFQSALNEFVTAIESYNRGEYKKCVLESEKSYESTMKIICNVASGTALQLLNSYITTDYIKDIPLSMNPEGFKSNVLMSLPYIRNYSNVGHGDGASTIQVTKAMAQLSLNLCSSLCTYMIETYLAVNEGKSFEENIDEKGESYF